MTQSPLSNESRASGRSRLFRSPFSSSPLPPYIEFDANGPERLFGLDPIRTPVARWLNKVVEEGKNAKERLRSSTWIESLRTRLSTLAGSLAEHGDGMHCLVRRIIPILVFLAVLSAWYCFSVPYSTDEDMTLVARMFDDVTWQLSQLKHRTDVLEGEHATLREEVMKKSGNSHEELKDLKKMFETFRTEVKYELNMRKSTGQELLNPAVTFPIGFSSPDVDWALSSYGGFIGSNTTIGINRDWLRWTIVSFFNQLDSFPYSNDKYGNITDDTVSPAPEILLSSEPLIPNKCFKAVADASAPVQVEVNLPVSDVAISHVGVTQIRHDPGWRYHPRNFSVARKTAEGQWDELTSFQYARDGTALQVFPLPTAVGTSVRFLFYDNQGSSSAGRMAVCLFRLHVYGSRETEKE